MKAGEGFEIARYHMNSGLFLELLECFLERVKYLIHAKQ